MSDVVALRLAGRWDDALAALSGRTDVDVLRERVLVIVDRNMLQGGAGEELDAGSKRSRPPQAGIGVSRRSCSHAAG